MIQTIETERFRLVPPSMDCLPIYEQFYMNAEASKMYGGPLNKSQVLARLKADLGSWYLMGFGVWVIQSKLDGSYLGSCGFWQGADWPTELTWWVTADARGQGVATETSLAVINFAYEHWNWHKVETYMNDDNAAARALVMKLGGEKVRRELFPDGLSRDIYLFPKR